MLPSVSDVEMRKKKEGMQSSCTFAIPLGENGKSLSATSNSKEHEALLQTVKRTKIAVLK